MPLLSSLNHRIHRNSRTEFSNNRSKTTSIPQQQQQCGVSLLLPRARVRPFASSRSRQRLFASRSYTSHGCTRRCGRVIYPRATRGTGQCARSLAVTRIYIRTCACVTVCDISFDRTHAANTRVYMRLLPLFFSTPVAGGKYRLARVE